MKILYVFIILILLASFIAIPAQAINTPTGGSGGGSCDHYYHLPVFKQLNVIDGGDVQVWSSLPHCGNARSAADILQFTGVMTGPPFLSAAGTGTLTWTANNLNGCTVGAFTTFNGMFASQTSSTTSATVTMTSNSCTGYIQFRSTVTVATVILFDAEFRAPLNIQVPDIASLNYECAASATTPNAFLPASNVCTPPASTIALSGQLAQLNYQCAASDTTPNGFNPATNTCTTPQVDNQNRFCAASALGAACTTPTINTVVSGTLALTGTITNPSCLTTNTCAFALSGTLNVVNSGGQNIAITSWPTLLATLSGGLTITDDANGWIIHQDPLSGTVNVVNSGGQTITVSSWPTLVAAISGDLDVHQDEACGAVVHCKVDMTCLANTCQSQVSNVTVNQNVTSSNNLFLGVIPYNLLLFAIAFFAIAAESRGDVLYWVICLILSIVLLVVRPTDSIVPTPFFIGWIFVVLYQMIALLSNTRARNLGGESQEE